MPPEVEKRLEDLQTRSGATSKAEVIRRALALYLMVLDVHDSGGSITLREPDGAEERLAILL